MPAIASTLPFPPQPRVKVVSSREDFSTASLPELARGYPELRYMGSKHRLLPWIHGVLRDLEFETAADPFVGSGCVAYLLKTMGKRVVASDFLNFPAVLAAATVANDKHQVHGPALKRLLARRSNAPHFIEQTFDAAAAAARSPGRNVGAVSRILLKRSCARCLTRTSRPAAPSRAHAAKRRNAISPFLPKRCHGSLSRPKATARQDPK